jgi:site-specific DNA-methyltransferase (adenine-specific)
MSSTILHGDCLQVLPKLQANSFDSLVTDPPASISFMGQAWDGDRGGRQSWVPWLSQVMREALRVLKPGAHGLVWAIPRRSHWTALALEDAGFEIRDCICHYFLSGFPKNMSVDKAIDKHLGAERPVVQTRRIRNLKGKNGYNPSGEVKMFDHAYTAPGSPEAMQWAGWGTHLKPAIEHWWLVRKPLSEKNVAANVLKWGTGALNIEACRIPVHQEKGNYKPTDPGTFAGRPKSQTGWDYQYERGDHTIWRAVFGSKTPFPEGNTTPPGHFTGQGQPRPADPHPDSRYPSHFIVSDWELLGNHSGFFHPPIYSPKARRCRGDGNHHPTVKPVDLMQYFITLLTRPRGHVLDCFAGSFSTGVAAQKLGCTFTGIEMDASYIQIGVRRMSA